MDAPTTTSAGNGESDEHGEDWDAWFTPKLVPGRTDPEDGDQDRGTGDGASPRPVKAEEAVGSPGSEPDQGGAPADDQGLASVGNEPGSGPTPPAGDTQVEEDFRDAADPAPSDEDPSPVEGGIPAPYAADAQTAADAVLLHNTMAKIEPIADEVISYFYALLFIRRPDLRDLFPAAMDAQRDRVVRALLTAAKLIDDEETFTQYLSHLGRGHRKYGTRPEDYPPLGESLLEALATYTRGDWTAETEGAWVRAYTKMSQIMIDAAAEDELESPAWWDAEIVSHDLRTPDIAVITVRPDKPYPFRAGQYTALETPWWPRIWRNYSFSSAPRPDGLLSFHVKAVPAGWVSGALVHRARPGDVLRLGPPVGSMTVDHGTDSRMLCLGGGTGIAPIKALIEDIAEYGRKRPVEVFYGARSDRDLYDIDTMQKLEAAHSWLSVRPVVAEGSLSGALRGPLPDAVRQHGPWKAYDAYLSGPPGMIRKGVETLLGIGIPSHRIRHDSVEELVAAGR
jgi:NAD(P)H-flavin reductase/hemoglobin-like flavoprotein